MVADAIICRMEIPDCVVDSRVLLAAMSVLACSRRVVQHRRLGAVVCMFLTGMLLLSLSWLGFSDLEVYDAVLSKLVNLCIMAAYIMVCVTESKRKRTGIKPPKEKPHPVPSAVVSPSEEEKMKALFLRIEAYMNEAKPFLESDFGEDDLSQEMYTNKAYLSRTVNRLSGSNFCQYVNAYRVRYAMDLIQSDHRLKVVDVALMSGFHSVVSFNMAFKLHMNCTPSEYQRNLQAEKLMQ